jgi:hypothetical protein
VIAALDDGPNAENTIIVLWSDHGWHLGEKLHWRKFALWEEATHNVLMFVAPGITQGGGSCTMPVSLLDIYPTLIDLCELTPRPGLEGNSLKSFLVDPSLTWDRPALTTNKYNNHSLRTERWRYIKYKDGTEELYDHQNDPMEWTNLAQSEEHAPIIEELAKWLPKTNAPESPPKEILEQDDDMPEEYILFQNYPNPFNPLTEIEFQVPRNGHITITVFNNLGQKVRTLVNEKKLAGNYAVAFDGVDEKGIPLPSGIYYYQMQIDAYVRTKKMILVQ